MTQSTRLTAQQRPGVTRRAAADYAGVSERTIDRWAREGLITRTPLRGQGARAAFDLDEIDALIGERVARAAS